MEIRRDISNIVIGGEYNSIKHCRSQCGALVVVAADQSIGQIEDAESILRGDGLRLLYNNILYSAYIIHPLINITNMPSGFYAVRDYIQRAMQVTFSTNKNESCAHCNRKIRYENQVTCRCGICTYCSLQCAENDKERHFRRCMTIVLLSAEIEEKTTALQRYYPDDEIALFDHSSLWVDDEELRPIIARRFQSERTELLNKRNTLIKELMDDGSKRSSSRCAGEYTNQNVFACQVAAQQSLDLLLLRKGIDDAVSVLQIHLLTGSFEKLYDLCCHYMLRGIYVTTRGKGLDMIGLKQIKHRNITKSYAPQVYEDYKLFGEIQFVALIHIFLVKYIFHMSMEGLHQINTNFLNNKDCMVLIGEYVGMKKEWIIAGDNNTYKDQAYKVARMIHCSNMYGYDANESKVDKCFTKIRTEAQKYFYFMHRTSVIKEAIATGNRIVNSFRLQQKLYKSMPAALWTWSDIINSFEADLAIVYNFKVRSLLMDAVGRINILAGWNIFGSISSHQCVTEFVTDALKTCRGYNFKQIFYETYSDSNRDIWRQDYDQTEELFDGYDVGGLDDALFICIAIEQKVAYCNFHRNKGNDDVMNILSQLREDSKSYISEPLPDSSDFAISDLIYHDCEDIDGLDMANENLITALFDSGMATKENLDILFGRSGYVSYFIWRLQKQKDDRMQRYITSYITRSRIWKEGYTDNDKVSGLKLKYLNKEDRAERFDELKKHLYLGNSLLSLEPSVGQFIARFGISCLNDNHYLKEFFFLNNASGNAEDRGTGSNLKRRRCDLDSFLNIEDACRHYFDTRSLEEAIWDHVGVPRIIELSRHDKCLGGLMGWKYCDHKVVLGDEAVKVGSRVVHHYDSSCCSVWKE